MKTQSRLFQRGDLGVKSKLIAARKNWLRIELLVKQLIAITRIVYVLTEKAEQRH